MALVLGGLGLLASLYLAVLHEGLAAGDLAASACSISAEIDCAPALRSRYASIAGVPVAVYGAWFYAVVIVIAAVGWVRIGGGVAVPRRIVLLGATAVAALVSVALGLLSVFVVGVLCPLCTLLYAINGTLFAIAGLDVARRPRGFAAVTEEPAQTLKLGGAVLATLLAIPIAYGFADRTSALCTAIRRAAADGPLTLTVYVDFQCPHCKQLDRQLRQARRKANFDVAIKPHPLDKDCNPGATRTTFPGSCLQARAAICAGRAGRLDSFVEQLFERGTNEESALIALAEAAGIDPDEFRSCLAAPATAAEVAEDLRMARETHVRVTPTIVLGDVRHVGNLSAEDLRCLENAGP